MKLLCRYFRILNNFSQCALHFAYKISSLTGSFNALNFLLNPQERGICRSVQEKRGENAITRYKPINIDRKF
jgi:hypothetical protein